VASDGRAGQGGIFYGWYIVAAVFFMVFVSIGFRQSYGVFVVTWESEYGLDSRGFLSNVASAGWVVNGLAQPVVGGLADRYGARVVTAVSLAVLGASTLAMAFSFNVWMLAFFFASFASFSNAGAMFTPVTPLIARWFVRKRGVALSIITAGGSAGAMLMILFATYLLNLFNWRVSLAAIAVIVLLALPLVLVVIRNRPSDLGLVPDGNTPSSAAGAARAALVNGPLTVSHWRDAYRSAPMWQLTLTYVVCGITTAVIAVHFVPFAKDEGITQTTAAFAFSILHFANMGSVLAVGFLLSDRLQRKNTLTLVYAVRGLGFLSLLVLPTSVGFWVFAIVAGSSWLATVPQTSALAAEIYGVRNSGSITGMLTMVHMFAGAVAVAAAGAAFDYFGSYDQVWLVCVLLLAGASLMAWLVREREVSARYAPMRLAEA
jgi:MFS family permease